MTSVGFFNVSMGFLCIVILLLSIWLRSECNEKGRAISDLMGWRKLYNDMGKEKDEVLKELGESEKKIISLERENLDLKDRCYFLFNQLIQHDVVRVECIQRLMDQEEES